MLITFYSDAYENIVMFGHIAQHLLKLMGHSGTVPGAILAKDIPEVLSRLEDGIQRTKSHAGPNVGAEHNEDQDPPISLGHRAFPLISMLKAAHKKNCNVMWR
jgi:hypothetical protein